MGWTSCSQCPHGLTDNDGNILPKYQGREYSTLPCCGCPLEKEQAGQTLPAAHVQRLFEGSESPKHTRHRVCPEPTTREPENMTHHAFLESFPLLTDHEKRILFRYLEPDRPSFSDIARENGTSRNVIWKTMQRIRNKTSSRAIIAGDGRGGKR